MSVAASSPLLVRISDRRNTSSGHRWIRYLAGALAAAIVAALIVATIIAAAGRVLAVSFDGRMETRSLIGRAPSFGGLSWFAMRDEGMVTQLSVAANVSSPGMSGTLDGASADPVTTGSIGKAFSIFGPPDVGAMARFELPAKRDDARALPLPRARPRLAALTPPGDFGIQMEDDAPSPRTAIYDITAQAVYMPNGEKLEAHSGLGGFMDDPKHVRLRMRGVTPPNTYRLKMREALFHGVEAIRMTPLDDSRMYGRSGILAHSYMLGPSGQSNGCISFKDYPKFLVAFKRGEVDHIRVVERLDKPPAFYAGGKTKRVANAL